jgi:hypothetical protein
VRRFWSKVAIDDGCWLWTACRDSDGYGRFVYEGKVRQATHVAWRLEHGSLPPDGMLVCHSCDTPACVNPAHLFLGTHLDNRTDCVAKGRAVGAAGDRNVARSHPERLSRGDAHWTRRYPERVPRGPAHWHFGKGGS